MKLSFGEPCALERDQADRQAGGIELQHDRRQRAGRQAAQIGQRQIGKFGHIGVGVGAGLEIDSDDAHARQRARFHVIDAGGEREEALETVGDIGLDILRAAFRNRTWPRPTTGMLMAGNRSTGMRNRLVAPMSTSIRQMTKMK